MNSGLHSDRRRAFYSFLFAFLFALLAVGARLPFLLTEKIPFDSDEAVEGLMARHVLEGDLPAFFWGQAFKGVPEVYAAAGAFAIFGSSVTVLKSVTLALFAAFIGLNFVLIDRILGRWMAAVTCLFLIVAPPALVFWSLDASAEFVLIMLLGTALLLLLVRAESSELRAKGKTEEFALGLVIGLGLWVHQLFWLYLFPAALILALQSEWWNRRDRGTVRLPVVILTSIAALYVLLAVISFTTGGFVVELGPLVLGVRAPQKMLRIGAAVAVLAAVIHTMASVSRLELVQYARRYRRMAAGFAVGYLPVILYTLLVEPARSPARVGDLRHLIGTLPDIFVNIIPILAGFKVATTERLGIPLAAAAIVVAALATYIKAIRGRLMEFARLHPPGPEIGKDFFPLFVVCVPLLFVVSGAYLDTQSYRYLIPYYAGLAVALAAGCLALAKGDYRIASVFVGMILIVFALQQFIWFGKLAPDIESKEVVDCLRREGILGGYADYWTSYKITFLANEDIIIAPTTGVDRHPEYTKFVQMLPEHQRVTTLPDCVVSH